MSLRSHEGYLLLDHSQTQGFSDEQAVAMGLPAGAGKGMFEAPTFTCSHCQTIVVIEPRRTRTRYHCRGCDHLLCDRCGSIMSAGAKCRTFKQLVDEYLELALIKEK